MNIHPLPKIDVGKNIAIGQILLAYAYEKHSNWACIFLILKYIFCSFAFFKIS